MGPSGDPEASKGDIVMDDHRPGQDQAEYPRGSSAGVVSPSSGKNDMSYREKQVKPNKVYVGGLPEHTRQEDLQSCFGKIGNIVNIELKFVFLRLWIHRDPTATFTESDTASSYVRSALDVDLARSDGSAGV
jgi:RNA recognition motif-containing protein